MDRQGSESTYGNGVHDTLSGTISNFKTPSLPTPLPPKQSKPVKADRKAVVDAFVRFGQFIHASSRPRPCQNGEGTFDERDKKSGLGEDLKVLRKKDIQTLKEVVLAKVKRQQLIDDKTMIMERVIQLVSNLPHDSKLRVELTNNFLNELWYSLDHPAPIFIADRFKYRMADGSYNNIHMPQLGAAGTYYARSVRPTVVPPGALPDPGLIFDSVMKRTEYRKHPNNVSSILWYWATIIIHDLFWTDHTDMSKSKTSSYLDLSPLYGSNQEMQDMVRTFKDGKLKVDSFADKRLIAMPPGVSVLLIMFNRFHNYVCDNLKAINEEGRFTPPADGLDEAKAAAAWKKYDEDLFQTARLVTSGLYINITLVDYVRNIVNLNRVDTSWTLDPRAAMGVDVGTTAGAERGVGNVVSAEFNLCYRWHSCISAKDDKWIQEFYQEIFGKMASQVTTRDLMIGFMKLDKMIPEDPLQREFGKFKRGSDGKFSDDDLVECISQAVEDCAGAFGGRNVPESMRGVEILGIIQGRKWNVAGLNEFRKHFGLKPYEKFEDINSDPVIAGQLRHLYEHPDFVELYPGLVAEEAKEPMVPGVGIAPTYTISRVVLSDAVCLVRGDRHYTTDYNPRYLTNWGFNEVQYDLNMNNGCVFYKLFIRAFPRHFKNNSVYAHYPMVIPSENHKILTDIGKAHKFDFTRPGRQYSVVNVTSYDGLKHVLQNQDKYATASHESLDFLLGQSGIPRNPSSIHAQLNRSEWHSGIKAFFKETTEQLLTRESYILGGHRQVDIVRDVGNIAQVEFVSRLFDLPLIKKGNPKGLYTPHELYMALASIFVCLYTDLDPVKAFPMRQAAQTLTPQLGKLVEEQVKKLTGSRFCGLFSSSSSKNDPLGQAGADIIKELSQSGMSNREIVWGQVLPAIISMVPNQGEIFAQAVDFYLSTQGVEYVPSIYQAANTASSEASDALLFGYLLEGVRLSTSSTAYREATTSDTALDDDGRKMSIRSMDRIILNFGPASRDPRHFPEPDTVNPRRPLDSYLNYGPGPHASLGRDVSRVALTEMFRALFRRKNVRRAPGPQGALKKVQRVDGSVTYLREDWGTQWSFPVTMKVMWDD